MKSTRAWAKDTSKQDTDLVPTIQTAEDNLKSSESPQREKCYKVSTLYRLLEARWVLFPHLFGTTHGN